MRYVHILWDYEDNLIEVFDDLDEAIKEMYRLESKNRIDYYVERGRIVK